MSATPKQHQKLVIPEGKERVRAVKSCVMRWIIEGRLVNDILEPRGNALPVQEYIARLFFVNAAEAQPGTKVAIYAAEALRKLVDGLEEGEVGQQVPVTLIDRILHDSLTGAISHQQELQMTQQVQLTSGREPDERIPVSKEVVDTEEKDG
jgi:hypothetical protein